MKSARFDELNRKISNYCFEQKIIDISVNSLSVADLLTILREYYQEIYDIYDHNSEFYKNFLNEVNNALFVEQVLKTRKGGQGLEKIRQMVRQGLFSMGKPWQNLNKNRCQDFYVCIKQNVCAIMLDIYEKGQARPVIVCRDIEGGQLYLAKGSNMDTNLLERMRPELLNIFDIVDSYRGTLPESANDLVLTEEIIRKDDIYEGRYYDVPFGNELFAGVVRVYANGKVEFDLKIVAQDEKVNVSQVLSSSNVENILKRICVNMDDLKEPIRSIVLSSFEKEYYVTKEGIKKI